ncbi:MAG: carbohydrate ABC transporter permease [Bacillaceae bacterium]
MKNEVVKSTPVASPNVKMKKKMEGNIKPARKIFIKIEPFLYLLPALILFGAFVYFPFIKTIFLSTQLTNFAGEGVEFVGLENYLELFKSEDFQQSILVTGKFVLLTTIPSVFFGLVLALLAQRNMRGSGLVRLLYALPMAVSSSCAALIWILLFHPTVGFVNKFFNLSVGWLSDPQWALYAVAVVTSWMNIGFIFLLLLSGLKAVSKDLYESAAIDGANYGTTLFKITLPLLSPTLFFVTVFSIINSFQAFGQIHVMTQGGPSNSTNVLAYAIYQEAFTNSRFGFSSAISIVLFLIMLIITLIQFRYEKKWVHYQ